MTVLAKMMLIRRFEERAGEMYAKAKIGGFLHLCIGEEATVVGATQALRETDYLMSTYREHGQALARGTDPNAVMAELFGRVDGCSKGRGGSMHLFDWDRRFLGGYGIVGGSLPLSAGVALACDYLGDRGRGPLDDGRRRHQPGHLRRDDEPRRAVEAAGRLPDHQQPVRDGHGAGAPLGGDRPVAEVGGLRRAGHALRRHGRARRAQRGHRGAALRARGAQAAAGRGGDLPLPRPLDGRPRGVPHQGGGRGVARARPDQDVRRAARGGGRAHARRTSRSSTRRRSRPSTRRSSSPTSRPSPTSTRSTTTSTCSTATCPPGGRSTSARPRCTAASTSARPASCRTSWPRRAPPTRASSDAQARSRATGRRGRRGRGRRGERRRRREAEGGAG